MQTPHLLVERERLEANLAAMARATAQSGVALRPHVKTHKSLAIAQRQLDLGATGLTVATIGEAEVFASICDDLLLAYPVWVTPESGARLRALGSRARVRVGVASVAGARNLACHRPGVEVLIEVDSGHHRTGAEPADAGQVAAAAADAGLEVVGVFTFPGHGYGPGNREAAAAEEAAALGAAARSLRVVGIEPTVVSGGSTPTVGYADAGVLTEVRPGVYPFGDAQQVELGTTSLDRVALTAVSTVVHAEGSRIVLDAGSKILGADRAPWATGHGRLPEHPEARVVQLSEHHAVADLGTLDGRAPRSGDVVRVIPNHVCTAVNLVDRLYVDDGSVWAVDARGLNG